MKALLRSSLFAFLLLGTYAGFASTTHKTHIPGPLPVPTSPTLR